MTGSQRHAANLRGRPAAVPPDVDRAAFERIVGLFMDDYVRRSVRAAVSVGAGGEWLRINLSHGSSLRHLDDGRILQCACWSAAAPGIGIWVRPAGGPVANEVTDPPDAVWTWTELARRILTGRAQSGFDFDAAEARP